MPRRPKKQQIPKLLKEVAGDLPLPCSPCFNFFPRKKTGSCKTRTKIMSQNRNSVTSQGGAYDAIISRPSESGIDSDQFSQNTVNATCPSCGSSRVTLVQMPQHCPHHSARRCGGCDRFLSWEPKPVNRLKRKEQQEMISQLLEFPHLTQWERQFLGGLKSKKLSPKQQEILERIKTKAGRVV